MRNHFKGTCFICGKEVLPKQGYFQIKYSLPKDLQQKIKRKWLHRCKECVGKGNQQLIFKLKEK